MSNIQALWKIFEEKNDKILNLFHGMIVGSREVEIGVLYKDKNKLIRDGSESSYYQSGIHAHYDIKSTEEWLKRHSSVNRHIYLCIGDVRESKKTSKGKVALCDSLVIISKYKPIGE